jgi:hypothetical protein
MSIFLCLGRFSKESVQIWGFLFTLVTTLFFYGEELLAKRPTVDVEAHPLSAVRDCLFNIFAAALHTKGVSSINNLRTRHAVATRDPTNMQYEQIRNNNTRK